MPMVELELELGEKIYAQPGAMQWMTQEINMEANMRGGIMGAFKRSFTGENIFLVDFECLADGGKVAFGHSFPGKIIPIDVSQKAIICQKRAFLCATEGVKFDVEFQRRLGAGFFGGEGFIMQKLSGNGIAFVELDGEYVVKELGPGETIRMETGALGMYEQGMDMSVEMVKGLKNIFIGGEGLFLTTITGPGKVWVQTMPAQSMAREIIEYLPVSNK